MVHFWQQPAVFVAYVFNNDVSCMLVQLYSHVTSRFSTMLKYLMQSST